ncbi:MAG: hypothetical protein WD080_00230 [Egibacteraceae bacterium]
MTESSQRSSPDSHGTVNLTTAAAELLEEARAANAGRAGRTLTPGAGGPLKQTLLALLAGQHLQDHASPGAATLQVLQGAVRLTTSDDVELGAGDHAPIPSEKHGLEARDDAVVLLTVAQPQGS